MCQSKEEGGRRCEQAHTSSRSKAKLKDLIRYHTKQGHDERVTQLENTLTHIEQAEVKYGKCVSPFAFDVQPETEQLLSSIQDSGYDPLIVGGSVRDVFQGSDSKDIDIEVYGGNIDQIAQSLRDQGYKVDEVGKSFGVLKTTLANGEDIDISVPRTESKAGTGHKGFEINTDETLTVEEASSRRDFTINSMMYSHEHKALIDPHHGKEDFESKTLRHVSDAFADDPLRVMRGFQFASRFGVDMAPETVTMCQSLREESDTLAEERMKTEWDKFYSKGEKPSSGLKVLNDTNWDSCYDGLREANTPEMRDEMDQASVLTKNEPDEVKRRVQSAVIASHLQGEDAKSFTNRTNLTQKEGQQAYTLSKTQERGTIVTDTLTLANDLDEGKTNIREWALVQKAKGKNVDGILQHAEKQGVLNGPEAPVLSGGEIIEHSGRKPGPWVGQLQREFKTAQANREFSNPEEGKEWVTRTLYLDDPSSLQGKVVFTHGLPGSGKSTWAKKLEAAHPDKVIRLSRDDIRKEILGDEKNYDSNYNEKVMEISDDVEDILHTRLKEHSKDKNNIIILDNVNLGSKTIGQLSSIANQTKRGLGHVYFPTHLDECKRRNNLREGIAVAPESSYETSLKSGFVNGRMKRAMVNKKGVTRLY